MSGVIFAIFDFLEESDVEISMVYGSEKRAWIEEVGPDFAAWYESKHNQKVKVEFFPLGSRESLTDILNGAFRPTIWSPASSVWIPLLNWQWKQIYGDELVKDADWGPLVRSPVVIASWEDYIQEKSISGFTSLQNLAASQNSDLRYAHTDPQLSNSGFMAVIMQTTVAAGKSNTSDIILGDLKDSSVKSWMRTLESRAVFYGKSTGFLAEQAINAGPEMLNVFVTYENLVIDSNKKGTPSARWQQRLQAIYPSEGVLLTDHPFCILDGNWVSEEEKFVAEELLRYLKLRETQAKAMTHGFRPDNSSVILDTTIFNELNGVTADPWSEVSLFSTAGIDAEVLWRIPDLWLATKK
ncbi:MAG: substrate-binding domain-containing protein [Candidatus Hodarchaeales archaeon]|jgi:Ca-activated chloride channel family protein